MDALDKLDEIESEIEFVDALKKMSKAINDFSDARNKMNWDYFEKTIRKNELYELYPALDRGVLPKTVYVQNLEMFLLLGKIFPFLNLKYSPIIKDALLFWY